VFACTVLPGITDKPSDLEALVAEAARAGARYLCSNVVFLMPSSQRKFFPFLEQKFPRLVKQYRKWFVRSGYAPENYRREISALMGRL
ncbi:radical SAM protein, partial [Acidobacteriia bacterium AH_259_A11_L15]|nr:radical SAM protein [Acidobacteriia bacterium AH_259_A11_L15]